MAGATSPQSIPDRLFAEYCELEDLLQHLVVALEANARDEIRRLWAIFELRLLSYMAAEEHFVMACLASHPKESGEMLEAHELLRNKLVELGTQIALGLAQREHATGHAAATQAHSSHAHRTYH